MKAGLLALLVTAVFSVLSAAAGSSGVRQAAEPGSFSVLVTGEVR